MTALNLLEEQAREIAGMPSEWRVYLWESITASGGDGYMLTGAIAPNLKSGKYKGLPNWKKRDGSTERKVFISRADQLRWTLEWEHKTGKCARCVGTGKTVACVSQEGTTYRDCATCHGTGHRHVAAEALS
jgi:hypothetical protein